MGHTLNKFVAAALAVQPAKLVLSASKLAITMSQ